MDWKQKIWNKKKSYAVERKAMEEIRAMKEKRTKEEKTYVTVKIDPEQEVMFDEIMKDYRAPTRAHALRLAIEDRFKEIGLREANPSSGVLRQE